MQEAKVETRNEVDQTTKMNSEERDEQRIFSHQRKAPQGNGDKQELNGERFSSRTLRRVERIRTWNDLEQS